MRMIKCLSLTQLFYSLQHHTSYLNKITLIVLAVIGIMAGILGIGQIYVSGLFRNNGSHILNKYLDFAESQKQYTNG